jgi:hypothetical protein
MLNNLFTPGSGVYISDTHNSINNSNTTSPNQPHNPHTTPQSPNKTSKPKGNYPSNKGLHSHNQQKTTPTDGANVSNNVGGGKKEYKLFNKDFKDNTNKEEQKQRKKTPQKNQTNENQYDKPHKSGKPHDFKPFKSTPSVHSEQTKEDNTEKELDVAQNHKKYENNKKNGKMMVQGDKFHLIHLMTPDLVPLQLTIQTTIIINNYQENCKQAAINAQFACEIYDKLCDIVNRKDEQANNGPNDRQNCKKEQNNRQNGQNYPQNGQNNDPNHQHQQQYNDYNNDHDDNKWDNPQHFNEFNNRKKLTETHAMGLVENQRQKQFQKHEKNLQKQQNLLDKHGKRISNPNDSPISQNNSQNGLNNGQNDQNNPQNPHATLNRQLAYQLYKPEKQGKKVNGTEAAHIHSFEVLNAFLKARNVPLNAVDSQILAAYLNRAMNLRLKNRYGNQKVDRHYDQEIIQSLFANGNYQIISEGIIDQNNGQNGSDQTSTTYNHNNTINNPSPQQQIPSPPQQIGLTKIAQARFRRCVIGLKQFMIDFATKIPPSTAQIFLYVINHGESVLSRVYTITDSKNPYAVRKSKLQKELQSSENEANNIKQRDNEYDIKQDEYEKDLKGKIEECKTEIKENNEKVNHYENNYYNYNSTNYNNNGTNYNNSNYYHHNAYGRNSSLANGSNSNNNHHNNGYNNNNDSNKKGEDFHCRNCDKDGHSTVYCEEPLTVYLTPERLEKRNNFLAKKAEKLKKDQEREKKNEEKRQICEDKSKQFEIKRKERGEYLKKRLDDLMVKDQDRITKRQESLTKRNERNQRIKNEQSALKEEIKKENDCFTHYETKQYEKTVKIQQEFEMAEHVRQSFQDLINGEYNQQTHDNDCDVDQRVMGNIRIMVKMLKIIMVKIRKMLPLLPITIIIMTQNQPTQNQINSLHLIHSILLIDLMYYYQVSILHVKTVLFRAIIINIVHSHKIIQM